ncbi:DUF3078 domain-containing protein [Flavobacteriales bacterium]|nr:DUF3078 domain-containing protein [Flavobacteriales bacterium]
MSNLRLLLLIVFSATGIQATGQMAVPLVEQAVLAGDDNPLDTVQTFKGTLGLNLSQTALTNWAGGGESSVAFTTLCNLSEIRECGPRSSSWGFDAALGLLRQQGGWRKTDDRLILTGQWNTAMQRALKDARLSVLIDARTQILPGYTLVDGLPDKEQRISDFLSPGYLVAAAGLAPNPGKNNKIFVAPCTAKLTVLMDDTLSAAGAFGVDAGQHSRLELGGYIRWNLTASLMENITWTHQVDLFSNYLNKPGNVDVNWTGLLELKVNEALRTTISMHLIYDDDVVLEKEPARTEVSDQGVVTNIPAVMGPGTQFKEVLSIGVSYTL